MLKKFWCPFAISWLKFIHNSKTWKLKLTCGTNYRFLDIFCLFHRWFDCYLLMLTDSVRNISLKTFTQMTPLPLDVVKKMESDTPKDYEKRSSGFPARLGNYMGEKMDVSIKKTRFVIIQEMIKSFYLPRLCITNGRKNTRQLISMT